MFLRPTEKCQRCAIINWLANETKNHAETRDRTGDLQIFSLTLSQLSYRGLFLKEHHSV